MRVKKSASSLVLHASVLDLFLGGTIPPAKTVRFDGIRGDVIVETGFLARRKRTVPFGRILKIRHRIAAPILRIGLDGGGHAYHRSVSAASEIRIELRDS
ncbi:MAG TPA: hypothetical protein VE080_02335, partial [Candidatus Aquicultoraceae bacterium]|nr:hypothetical protein [Candidatus Aquicultoraceae bacterium]